MLIVLLGLFIKVIVYMGDWNVVCILWNYEREDLEKDIVFFFFVKEYI